MKKFRTFFFTCGILMAASEIWKQLTLTFLINHGAYDWWYFPFQLCSIPMYICLILPVISSQKYPRLHQILLTFLNVTVIWPEYSHSLTPVACIMTMLL